MRKKKTEKVETIYKNPKLTLFNQSLVYYINKAIEKDQYKIITLDSESFPKHLRIDKVKLNWTQKDDRIEVFQWLDYADAIDSVIGGCTSYYMTIWKLSSAGFITKDIKRGDFNKYSILTFNSPDGVKKALIRSMYDEVTQKYEDPEEYKNMMLRLNNSNILNIIIDGINYAILKIININEDWGKYEKLYDDWELLNEYTVVYSDEEDLADEEYPQEELF